MTSQAPVFLADGYAAVASLARKGRVTQPFKVSLWKTNKVVTAIPVLVQKRLSSHGHVQNLAIAVPCVSDPGALAKWPA